VEELGVKLGQWVAVYGLKVGGAVAILVLGVMAAKILAGFFAKALYRAKVDDTLTSFGVNALKFLLFTVVAIATLNQMGFATTSLIAVLGAAGLAVALSLQGQLSSLAAGVLILVTRPFKAGDMVEVAGTLGTVEAVTVLQTKLKGFDGTHMVLPNTNVFGNKIINYHTSQERRVDLVFGIGYEDDVARAKEIITQAMAADSRVLAEPAPSVVVSELADSSVNLTARAWVLNADWWAVRCDLLELVKAHLDQAGISIPFPQRDVHLIPGDQSQQSD